MTTYSDINGTTLLTGSSDPDGDTLTVRRLNGAVVTGTTATVALTEGTATVNLATGVVTLDDGGDTSGHPADGVTGQANGSFTFTIWDGALESPVRTATVTLNGVALSTSGTDFGALTRSGAGGIPLPSGASSITNAGGTSLTVSGGFVVPSSNGVTAGTVTFDNADTWDVTTTPNAYSVRSNAEASALMTSPGVATVSGKSIVFRAGNYPFDASLMSNRAFTAVTTVTAETLGPVLMTISANTNVTFTNVRYTNIDLYAPYDFATHGDAENSKGVIFNGYNDNVWFEQNEIRANLKDYLLANGIPYKMSLVTWRGIFSGSNGSTVGPNGIHFKNNDIHGSTRLLSLGMDGGPIIIEGNTLRDFGSDAVVVAGARTTGTPSFSHNEVYDPLNAQTATVSVLSVDVANDILNVADATLLGPVGSSFRLNFKSGTPPSPYFINQDLTGVIENSTQVRVTQGLSNAGSGSLSIAREFNHSDAMQVVANDAAGNSKTDQYNWLWEGNKICLVRFDDLFTQLGVAADEERQGIFAQDIASPSDQTHFYRNAIARGNMIYTLDTTWGLAFFNSLNGLQEHNTIITEAGHGAIPALHIASQQGGGNSGNTQRGNAAKSFQLNSPNTGLQLNNLAIDANNGVETFDYAQLFVNPTGRPTSIDDMLAKFAPLGTGPLVTGTGPTIGAIPHMDFATGIYTPPVYA